MKHIVKNMVREYEATKYFIFLAMYEEKSINLKSSGSSSHLPNCFNNIEIQGPERKVTHPFSSVLSYSEYHELCSVCIGV